MKPTHQTPEIIPQADWGKARPEKLPQPTYWPFFLALGIAFLFWGLLTSWIIGLMGGGMMVFSLGGWIANLRHESRNDRD